MAVNNNITLMDLAVADAKPLRKAILYSMFQSRLVTPIEVLPIKSASSLTQTIIRITDYGTPATRNLDETASAYSAQFADKTETLKIIENTIKIDPTHLDIKTYVQDPVEMRVQAYSKALKAYTNDLFINGDPTVVASQPSGLAFRFANDAYFSGQGVNAGGLDVDASDINMYQWLDYVDEAIDLANGQPDYMVVNRQTFNRFRSVLRRQKLFDTTRDQFDRTVLQYGGVKIINSGMKASGLLSAAPTGQVIGNNTSTSVFGTTNTTPMYFLSTGANGVSILQLHPMRVKRLGIDPGEPSQSVIAIKWPMGFLVEDRFAVSSVQGLTI